MAMNLSNLSNMAPIAGDVTFKTIFEFFDDWKTVVRLHRFDYNADTDKLDVAYVHVSGCDTLHLKNANTLLRAYLNTLTDLGTCAQVRLRVWG
jgi:hypothetical protein